MAQAKRKTATKTAKKTTMARRTTGTRTRKQEQQQGQSNMFFVISMSVLAATLLFANLLMMVA
ncbi:hypothetical protein IKD98_02505 [Candidatus Saccharibacteria bacterium]|nr:hypothetical protein [Candidatus Saccharibacteria bacterium]